MVNLKTINGEKKTKGMVTLKIKIYNIEKMMDIFVVDNENFNHDFLIGLDCIKNFKLTQNETLNIIQCNDSKEKKKTVSEEDTSNITNVKFPDALGDENEEGCSSYSEVLKQETKHMNKYEYKFQ